MYRPQYINAIYDDGTLLFMSSADKIPMIGTNASDVGNTPSPGPAPAPAPNTQPSVLLSLIVVCV